MTIRSTPYLLSRGWEKVSGSGSHSYWRRPADHAQRKKGKIYIRESAMTIQKSVDKFKQMENTGS